MGGWRRWNKEEVNDVFGYKYGCFAFVRSEE